MSEQSKIDAERAAFEAHMLGREHPVIGWISSNWFVRGDDPATYANDYVQGCWVMWQARSLPVGVPDGEWVMHMLEDRWPDSGERIEVEAFADWLREVLAAPTVKAEQVQTGADWVMRLLDTGEWRLVRFHNDTSMTEDFCRRNAWHVERQCAPYCGDNEVTFWRAETAEQAFTAAINDLFPGRAAEFGRPAPSLPAAGSAELITEAERCLFVLREIGSTDADDITGDNVDLRFEDDEGRDTGCEVSIVDYAEKSADVIEKMIAALSAQQSAPSAITRDQIRDVFMRSGFTIKDGQTDLKPYVYAAAQDLLALVETQKSAPERVSVPRDALQWPLEIGVEAQQKAADVGCDREDCLHDALQAMLAEIASHGRG